LNVLAVYFAGEDGKASEFVIHGLFSFC